MFAFQHPPTPQSPEQCLADNKHSSYLLSIYYKWISIKWETSMCIYTYISYILLIYSNILSINTPKKRESRTGPLRGLRQVGLTQWSSGRLIVPLIPGWGRGTVFIRKLKIQNRSLNDKKKFTKGKKKKRTHFHVPLTRTRTPDKESGRLKVICRTQLQNPRHALSLEDELPGAQTGSACSGGLTAGPGRGRGDEKERATLLLRMTCLLI